MRIRHFLFMAVPVVVATIGVLAVTLYHPLVGGRRQLSLSQLITAPAAGAVQRPAGAEKTIEQTDPPAVGAVAQRYQPSLVVSAFDRLWPRTSGSRAMLRPARQNPRRSYSDSASP